MLILIAVSLWIWGARRMRRVEEIAEYSTSLVRSVIREGNILKDEIPRATAFANAEIPSTHGTKLIFIAACLATVASLVVVDRNRGKQGTLGAESTPPL
jgi:hypothetical protein